jgi:membrane protein DedA with SNARE-associated domain
MSLSFETASAPASLGLVGLLVALESMGLPVPGELSMVGAAIYAATTGQLSLTGVIAAAACGAILGGIGAYVAGMLMGPPMLALYGPRIGLTMRRQKLGRYPFLRYGVIIVFAGRFFTVARNFSGLLAGINQMPLGRFLAWNFIGGALWPIFHCSIAYAFGSHASSLSLTSWALLILVIIGWILIALRFARHHEEKLHKLAEEYEI